MHQTIKVISQSPKNIKTDLLVVMLGLKHDLADIGAEGIQKRINKIKAAYISKEVSRDEVIKLDKSFKAERLLVLNGSEIKYQNESEKIKSLCAKAVKTAASMGCKFPHLLMNLAKNEETISFAAEGLGLGNYEFSKYKSDKGKKWKGTVTLVLKPEILKAAHRIIARTAQKVEGVNLARDLINEPSNVASTSYIVNQAKTIFKRTGIKVKVLQGKALIKERCQGLLNVGAGGRTPPAMVILDHIPLKKSKTHLVLVGKGICFDTGGISLKPASEMWEMKTDMSGAASVLGIMKVIAAVGSDYRVTGILCLAENGPDSRSYRPGDIFYAKNGKSIMVDNTDAEGRLVLSDGLCMACDMGATHIIDFATLTGACVVALGEKITGLMSNSMEWADSIIKAAGFCGETYWELPLLDEYNETLKTEQADLKNVGDKWAGAITAGLFLKEFVIPGVKWAHLDIAGTNWVKKPWRYFCEGATGVGVRPVLRLLEQKLL
ncbi:MAG: leucyl aminopeptidase [bacterium]